MSLQYSGSTIINRTATMVTRTDLVNFITQALFDAGWSTINGTPGNAGTTLVVQESAAGNQGQKVRIRAIDPGTGVCANFAMSPVGNSPISQLFFGNPSGTWRVVATKFQVFAFVSGSASKVVSRTNIMAGILYAPTFLTFAPGDALGFMAGNATADTDASNHLSWRNTLASYDLSTSGGRFSGFLVASVSDLSGWSNNDGGPSIANWQGGWYQTAVSSYRWQDGTLPAYEPLVLWSPTGISGESKIQGQLYDAMVMNEAWGSETSITYDGHTWIAVTDNATIGNRCRSTLFIAVT